MEEAPAKTANAIRRFMEAQLPQAVGKHAGQAVLKVLGKTEKERIKPKILPMASTSCVAVSRPWRRSSR